MASISNEQLAERIAPVLEAVAERIHYAEARRANYSVMAGALFAAGVTILTLASGAMDALALKLAAAFAASGMIATGLLIIWLFGQQTNRYPFTSATTTWKWFYRDALPNASSFSMSWPRYVRWGKDESRVRNEYGAQLPNFRSNMLMLADTDKSLDQDIEQLYVLHITEAYKNLFLKHLRQAFNWGIVSTIVLGAVGALWGSRMDAAYNDVRIFTVTVGGIEQRFEGRYLTPATADTRSMVVRASVSNQSAQRLTVGDIRVIDRSGWRVPIEVEYLSNRPALIEKKSSVKTSFVVKFAENTTPEIGGMSFDLR